MRTKPESIPEVVVLRLPLYLRALRFMAEEGKVVVNSEELGARLQLTPAQIRKDLSYFGRFGKQGKGYNVKNLQGELSRILSADRQWRMMLVGIGRLGRAILSYGPFVAASFKIVAALDRDPNLIGKRVGSLTIEDVKNMAEVVSRQDIQIGVVAVPPPEAQKIIDQMTSCGVKAILNYAPLTPRVPPGVKIRNIDPVLALQSMTYYLNLKGEI